MEEVLKVRSGEILIAQDDIEYKSDTGNTMTVLKGDKSIVGFDGMIHCLKERYLIRPEDEIEIEGYSATGLAQFLMAWLDRVFDMDKVLSKSEIDKDDMAQCIEAALVEIGMTAEAEEDEEDEEGKE